VYRSKMLHLIGMISRVASTGSNPGDVAFRWHTTLEVRTEIVYAAANAWSWCMTGWQLHMLQPTSATATAMNLGCNC
jgi:hypothetical protein